MVVELGVVRFDAFEEVLGGLEEEGVDCEGEGGGEVGG